MPVGYREETGILPMTTVVASSSPSLRGRCHVGQTIGRLAINRSSEIESNRKLPDAVDTVFHALHGLRDAKITR